MKLAVFLLLFLTSLVANETVKRDINASGFESKKVLETVPLPYQGKRARPLEEPSTVSSFESYLLGNQDNAPTALGAEALFPVDLIDVALQALSKNYKILANQEKLYQAKRNIDKAYGDYLPSIDVSYTLAKTEERPGKQRSDQTLGKAHYFGDERYTLSLSQNIYAGGDTENNIQRLKAKYMLAKADFERLLEEETSKAISAYIDVVFRREALEANTKNMEKLEEIFSIVKTKYESGALSVGELGNIEASVSNAKSLLSRTSSRYANAREYYRFVTHGEFEHTYPYEKKSDLHVKDLESLIEDAFQGNTRLRGFDYDVLAQKYMLKKTRSLFRPKVNLKLVAEKITDQEDYEFDEKQYIAQLTFNYNLYNGGKDENEYLRVFSGIQELEYEKEAEKQEIKYDIEKLHTSLSSHLQNIENIENEVNSSQKMVDAYWEAFRMGEQDLHVLLQGQRQLNSAELDYIENQQGSMEDFFNILKISGRLLEYFYIDLSNENFLDLARANYKSFSSSKISLKDVVPPKVAKEEVFPESVESKTQESVEEVEQIEKIERDLLATLLDFQESFLTQPKEKFTLVLPLQPSVSAALQGALKLGVKDDFFLYGVFSNASVRAGVAHGIFDDEKTALRVASTLTTSQLAQVKTIGAVQEEAKSLESLLLIEQKQVDELYAAFVKAQKEALFATDALFKERFLAASPEALTISLGTLPSLQSAGDLLKKLGIAQESFVFKPSAQTPWVRVLYGIFDTHEAAEAALGTLRSIEGVYFPIIERIGAHQSHYQSGLEP
ncbi:MAG: TolC family protein [Campylobacterales bacterium]|nr:TolC family protein [Campylobacterales bacterium]